MPAHNIELAGDILGRFFADKQIAIEDIEKLEIRGIVTDFPRSVYCKCKRCTSPYAEKVTLGRVITVITRAQTYSVFASVTTDPFIHPQEGEE